MKWPKDEKIILERLGAFTDEVRPLQEARQPADEILHLVKLIRKSQGYREDNVGEWMGPWLHKIEDAAKKLK